MYLKNAFKLVFSNLHLVFRAMLFRLVVIATSLLITYGISYLSISVVLRSAEMSNFINDIKTIWQSFIGGELINIDLRNSLNALFMVVSENIGRIIGGALALTFVMFVTNYVLGVCDYTIGVMLDKHMSSITKTKFIQTFLETVKRSLPFELFFTAFQMFFNLLFVIITIVFIVLTLPIFSVISIVIGLWMLITLVALFQTITSRLRPRSIQGLSIKESFSGMCPDKKHFATIFASQVFAVVCVAYLNISMFIVTLGAGIMVSVPLGNLFLIALQLVVNYTLDNKRYYIDYDNIVVPKMMRGEDEQLLEEIEI